MTSNVIYDFVAKISLGNIVLNTRILLFLFVGSLACFILNVLFLRPKGISINKPEIIPVPPVKTLPANHKHALSEMRKIDFAPLPGGGFTDYGILTCPSCSTAWVIPKYRFLMTLPEHQLWLKNLLAQKGVDLDLS